MFYKEGPKTLTLLVWICVFACQQNVAAKPEWCAKYLAYLSGDKTQRIEPQLETVDDMLWAFSNGLVPDPHSEAQLRAFEVYLRMRFGDSSKASSSSEAGALKGVIAKIAKKLKKHPELGKVSMRNFIMASRERSYPVTEDLQALTKKLSEAGASARASLFQMDANLGYWKRILGWVDRDLPAELQSIKQEWPNPEKERVRKARQDWAKAEEARFTEFLEQVLPASLRQELGNSNDASTTTFVKHSLAVQGDPISGFKPHPHKYSLDSAHSRAEEGWTVRKVAELKLPDHVQLGNLNEVSLWG